MAGWIVLLRNLSVLGAHTIRSLPDTRSYNVTAGQTNYSSWSSKYLTNEQNNNWK